MVRALRAADLFCGAGGTSQGAEQSGAARVVCAVNHWQVAVETHSANFPHARHINSRIDQVNPGECPKIDLLFASPECTHHSRARGGKPTSDQQRSGAWDLMRWVEYHRPTWIVVENVPEFREWGPVGDNGRPLQRFRGKFFDAWQSAIRSAGYRVDHQLLNAADYGAATSRTRLFVVARKGGRTARFPEPTHAKKIGGELPGMGLRRWRAAAEIVDWSIPCRSVFARKHPLKDNTLARIEAGLRKFVGPFVARVAHGSGRWGSGTEDLRRPLPTLATSKDFAIAVPFQFSSLSDGAARGIGLPTPTQTATGGVHLCVPFLSAFHNGADGPNRNYPLDGQVPTLDTQNRFAIVAPHLIQLTHGGRELSLDKPLRTITTANRGETAIAIPFVTTYYANGKPYPVRDPLCTISTRDRCGLATAIIEPAPSIEPRSDGERKLVATMVELGVADVGFRMLANHELAAAQGFPATYRFCGNKGDVTRQIGNAVCPDVAAAITRELAGAA